ncbi:MAG: hypothetical protein KatS3mg068_1553 [Candidatus Sericytochromatia bacterium]|nr:MAG: hypothetical protein KatS3mg068_1553 [Candidatus Sericytochromatia bacterium]
MKIKIVERQTAEKTDVQKGTSVSDVKNWVAQKNGQFGFCEIVEKFSDCFYEFRPGSGNVVELRLLNKNRKKIFTISSSFKEEEDRLIFLVQDLTFEPEKESVEKKETKKNQKK